MKTCFCRRLILQTKFDFCKKKKSIPKCYTLKYIFLHNIPNNHTPVITKYGFSEVSLDVEVMIA